MVFSVHDTKPKHSTGDTAHTTRLFECSEGADADGMAFLPQFGERSKPWRLKRRMRIFLSTVSFTGSPCVEYLGWQVVLRLDLVNSP